MCGTDHLARNLADLLNITKEFQVKGVGVRFSEESLFLDASESDATMTKVIVSMLGAVAEFERSMIRERQREGIELAKKRVVYKRRKPTDAVIIEKAREQVNPGTLLAQLVRESGFARSTLYRHLQQMQQQTSFRESPGGRYV